MREVFDITVPWISNIPARPVACLLCGERHIHPLNTFVLNGARFHTVRCLSDGMMWLDPQPTLEFYHRLYAEHYHLASQQVTISELLRRHRFEVLRFGSFAIWKPNKYPGELPSMNVLSRKA